MQNEFFIGLDLGQSQDPTAVAILARTPIEAEEETPAPIKEKKSASPLWRYNCTHIERLPLGTRYPAIVEYVGGLLETPELKGQSKLVIDATGVGRPVADLFSQAKIPFTGVLITGGQTVTHDGGMSNVPKRVLVSTLQVLLQAERLTLAPHEEREALAKELQNFQITVTEAANDTYAGRTGTHDDMVLAVALAAWKGENYIVPRRSHSGSQVTG